MFPSRLAVLFVLLTATAAVAPAMAAPRVDRAEKNLPPHYRHWLDEEVPYIIETQERAQFLALHTDAERDAFIRSFWDARNPTPGSEINTYKEEHYRRLAYANEHFGAVNLQNGWRTDEGRIYITLGAPQSIVTYPSPRNVRPLVIWFYSSPSPALPSYFYIVFFKRSIGEPYTIYSPYQDGPNKLVTGLEDLNDQTRSLKTIRKSLGDEVARLAVSLLPTEPVDLDNFSPTMMSDEMLATIRTLPDNQLQKQQLALRREQRKVTASIITTSNTPHVGYTVSRDERGLSTVNYLIQFPEPDATIIGQRKDKTLGYDLTLQNHITTESGAPVYDDFVVLTSELQPAQADVGRKKPFAAEDRFPLVPGRYIIQSTLTNNLTLAAHRTLQTVVVPRPSSTALGISEPFVYNGNPVRDEGSTLPFSVADVRFSPRAVGTLTMHAGDRVPVVFQLWVPKDANGKPKTAPIQLHYLYGSPVTGGNPIDESDETVDPSNADAAGNFVTGHVFQTGEMAPGTYRLIIRATQEGSAPVFSTMTLRVVPSDIPVGDWTAYGPPRPDQDEQKRALAAKAQAKVDQAKVASPAARP
ncbi:MAG TPA: GWxTD domain-containing protein [Acidobacteriaceae bacterium]|nr:GWxTD domain-containing protein [Acidobacteriaceae bacterium]